MRPCAVSASGAERETFAKHDGLALTSSSPGRAAPLSRKTTGERQAASPLPRVDSSTGSRIALGNPPYCFSASKDSFPQTASQGTAVQKRWYLGERR